MRLSESPPNGVRPSGTWVFIRSSKFETLRDFRFCSIFGVACLCVSRTQTGASDPVAATYFKYVSLLNPRAPCIGRKLENRSMWVEVFHAETSKTRCPRSAAPCDCAGKRKTKNLRGYEGSQRVFGPPRGGSFGHRNDLLRMGPYPQPLSSAAPHRHPAHGHGHAAPVNGICDLL